MKENEIILEENKQPLIEIDNEIIEMSKNVKIINSLKEDIDQLISSKNINNNIPTINDKYNKIKTQIQKFMNKKKFIYNFIDNEKLEKKNNKNIIPIQNDEEENEKLIEDKNNIESIKQNINKMQNRIIAISTTLDKKLSELNILKEQKQTLSEEIKNNDINDNEYSIFNNNNQSLIKSSILNLKAQQYNEQTKALEETNKLIDQIKKDTNEMKLISNSQENTINYLKHEHDFIGLNIKKGVEQLNERKKGNQSENSALKKIVIFLIILIIISCCFLYYKFKYKK